MREKSLSMESIACIQTYQESHLATVHSTACGYSCDGAVVTFLLTELEDLRRPRFKFRRRRTLFRAGSKPSEAVHNSLNTVHRSQITKNLYTSALR